MQLLVLALAMGIFLHDSHLGLVSTTKLTSIQMLGLVFVPKLVLALLYALAARLTRRSLSGPHSRRALTWLDRVNWAYRWAALALYGADLRAGALDALRHAIGKLVLVDDVLFMLPTLVLVAWAWWCYYPIDRRLREGPMPGVGRTGQPVWTRFQFLVAQFRHQIAIMLVPILAIMAWEEAVDLLPDWTNRFHTDIRPALVAVGAGGVFLMAPVMMRHIWDTVPLPAGPLRDMLLGMCSQYKIRIRELLLWRTFGGMVNAAVMGFFAPIRFILMTDALLASTSLEQIEAVMAHELAHVRRHHLFWLMVVALAAIVICDTGTSVAFDKAADGWTALHWSHPAWFIDSVDVLMGQPIRDGVAGLAAIVLWVLILGWVSRRFERQADTFAVQHLARRRAELAGDAARAEADNGTEKANDVRMDPASVAGMVDALQQVAILNYIPPARRSWRHGSILWRQQYLQTLVGQPVDRVAIDRCVFWVKIAAAAGLGLTIALSV